MLKRIWGSRRRRFCTQRRVSFPFLSCWTAIGREGFGEYFNGTNATDNANLGLRADHVPVKKMNMTGVWIDRGNEGQDYEKLKDEVVYAWKFSTLGEMADAVKEAFEAQGKKV